MIKHAYIAPYTLDNHIILYVSQDKKILLTNEYLSVKGNTRIDLQHVLLSSFVSLILYMY